MATIGGYNVVTNGLVFSLDAANRRSYVSGSGTWFDVSGNGNSGSLVNGPTFNSGNGGSIVFDGVDDYVNCGNSNAITTFSQMTINCWVRPANFPQSYNQGSVIIRGDDSYRMYWYYDMGGATQNKLYFYSADIDAAFTDSVGYETSNFVSNTWYNINATYDGSATRLYVNGSLVATSTGKSGTISGTNDIILGRSTIVSEYFYNGRMSAVQIYNRALSATEILQNYNATKGRFGL